MVLMAAGGMTNTAIARELGTHTDKVGRWRRRYADKGIKGIEKERPRGGNHGGRCPKAQAALRTEIIRRTTQERPPDATHWSCRSMARAVGTTHSFVNTVWRSAGLKPHLWRTFKVSTDPRFEEKLQDVVALYLNPPDNAVVFSFDEKSSVQALDRTQPGLPLKPGRCGTMTHDYKRHGTTSLFAAMDVASGEVIGETYRRHRHQELLRFLRKVEKAVGRAPQGARGRLRLNALRFGHYTSPSPLSWAWAPRTVPIPRPLCQPGGRIQQHPSLESAAKRSLGTGFHPGCGSPRVGDGRFTRQPPPPVGDLIFAHAERHRGRCVDYLPGRALPCVPHRQELQVVDLFPRLRERVPRLALRLRDPDLLEMLELPCWVGERLGATVHQ